MSGAIKYRPDIDGLRAIAVGSVFLFHLDEAFLPGGFVGVDVFFVISGFLITRILATDIDAGAFSFLRFYQRRVARLFPVMLVVILATLLAAKVLYSPQDYASAGVNSAASLLSLANVKFFLQGNYFEISPDAQPFLHFWSLSVEEQFYIFYPFLLVLIAKWFPTKRTTVIVAIVVTSLVLCIAVSPKNESAAFYLLPFRAWELGVGGLLALKADNLRNRLPPTVRKYTGVGGLMLIAASLLLLSEDNVFPGWVAIVPVLGSAAILFATGQGSYTGRGILCWAPIVAIGKVSYTLYLWHWPVFSFVDYTLFAESEVLRVSMKVGLCASLTVLTHVVVENPTREWLNLPKSRWLAIGGALASFALIVPTGLSIRSQNYVNATLSKIENGGIYFPGDGAAPKVLLLGDSHGSMYGRLLKDICRMEGCTLRVASAAAGDALPRLDGDHSELWRASVRLAEGYGPDVIVFVARWESKLGGTSDRLDRAVEELTALSEEIVLLTQPPLLPETASRDAIRHGGVPPFEENPAVRAKRNKANSFVAALQSADVTVVDIAPLFEDQNSGVLFQDERGRQLYHDDNHLSGHGADRVRELVAQAIVGGGS